MLFGGFDASGESVDSRKPASAAVSSARMSDVVEVGLGIAGCVVVVVVVGRARRSKSSVESSRRRLACDGVSSVGLFRFILELWGLLRLLCLFGWWFVEDVLVYFD